MLGCYQLEGNDRFFGCKTRMLRAMVNDGREMMYTEREESETTSAMTMTTSVGLAMCASTRMAISTNYRKLINYRWKVIRQVDKMMTQIIESSIVS